MRRIDVRKLIALVLVTALLGAPVGVFGQSQGGARLATISGEVLDAGGRALVNQRVELVRAGDVVQSTTTGGRGEWSFTNVAPDDYIVRTVVNGKTAGIRVSVTSNQTIARALIVAPSAAVPSAAFLSRFGLLGGTLVAGAIVAAIITTVVKVTGS